MANIIPMNAPVPTPPAESAGPLLLDAKRLAELLSVGLRTVRSWDSGGKLPEPLRIGGSVRWARTEIEAWILNGCPSRVEWHARRSARN